MDYRDVHDRALELFKSGRFDDAIAHLEDARYKIGAMERDHVLDLLMDLMHMSTLREPPDYKAAESYAIEAERVSGSGYAKLQTAMLFYWAMKQPERATLKGAEALELSRRENDTATSYQCLALLGLASLDTGDTRYASDSLCGIEQMVAAQERFVVGDETLFLERMIPTVDSDTKVRIRKLASTLASLCRGEDFAARLRRIANPG